MDIPRNNSKIGVLIHKKTLVSPLIEMTGSFITPVEITGIGNIKTPHKLPQIARRRYGNGST